MRGVEAGQSKSRRVSKTETLRYLLAAVFLAVGVSHADVGGSVYRLGECPRPKRPLFAPIPRALSFLCSSRARILSIGD